MTEFANYFNNINASSKTKTIYKSKRCLINRVVGFLFGLYLVTTLIVPSFFINKVFFLAIMFIWLIYHGTKKISMITPFIIIAIVFYGFLVSLLTYSDIALARQFLLAPTVLLLYYPCKSFKVNMARIIKVSCLIIIAFNFLFLLYCSNSLGVVLPFNISRLNTLVSFIPPVFFNFIDKYGEIAVGNRSFFSGITIMVHLGGLPFVYLGIYYWSLDLFKRRRYISLVPLLIAFFVIVLSSTRAMLLCSAMCVFIVFVFCVKNKTARIGAFLALSIAALYLLAKLSTTTDFFNVKEASNSIKIGHIVSFFESDDLCFYLIFGKGLGSYYYSSGSQDFIAHTEITFLDYSRYIGLPLTILLYCLLIFPFKVVKNRNTYMLCVVFLVYVIMSFTNPVLFNSFGLFVVVWYWQELSSYSRKNKTRY